MADLVEPSEEDDVRCHLQQRVMGGLSCKAARETGDSSRTDEVTPTICFNCDVGKIYREVGCDAVSPRIRIYRFGDVASHFEIERLFCSIRTRYTTLEYCRKCGLATAETTKQIVSTARGLFENHDFYSAFQDIEKAREAIRDGNFKNAVTRSISCLESTMRVCHEKLRESLPAGRGGTDVTSLWKSTRAILQFDEFDPTGSSQNLMNTLGGVVNYLGQMRNALGDVHGRGVHPPAVSEVMAELAVNTASTLSTAIVRRFTQIWEKENGDV